MSNSSDNPPTPSTRPPVVRRGPGRAIVLIACGVVIAGLLLVVVFNLEHPAQQDATPAPTDDIIDLVKVPAALDAADLEGRRRGGLTNPDDLAPVLEEGTWIQVANERGELAQQYRCRRLTPNPDDRPAGWFGMEGPEAEVYLSDNRVVTLAGDRALAYSPSRALESGTITGNVRIRLYEPDEFGGLDLATDAPALEVRTEAATFDNVSGELRCDGDVEIETRELYLPGRRLLVLFDDQQNRFRLKLDEVDHIRLTGASAATAASPRPADGDPATAPRGAIEPGRAPGGDPADPIDTLLPDDTTFYVLSLSGDVRIVDGVEPAARIITGEALEVIFTFQSEGLGESVAAAPHERPGARVAAVPPASMGPELALASYADPAPDERVTIITCTGPMTIDPLDDPRRQLASPTDMLLKLSGPPVLLEDQANQTTIECAELRYVAAADPDGTMVETAELLGSPSFPMTILSPEMQARADHLWLRPGEGTGRIEGEGWMAWREIAAAIRAGDAAPPDPLAPPEVLDAAPRRHLRVDWGSGVDLAFAAPAEGGGLGPLRRATFGGDVRAGGDSFRLDAASLATEFSTNDDGTQTLAGIEANGAVDAEGLGDRPGAITCEFLHLATAPDADGQPQPTRLLATGDVHAFDPAQSIWTQRLEVAFSDPDLPMDVSTARSAAAGVDSMLAEGSVQVWLDDGTRVFADRLEADARRRSAEITGHNLVLARDDSMIDRATRLTLLEETGLYALEGPGRLRVFDQPIVASTPDALDPDAIGTGEHLGEQLRVTWRERAQLDEKPEAESLARVATFIGDVQARSDDLDLDDAERLVARFASDADGAATIEALDAYGRALENETDDAARVPLHITLRQRPVDETTDSADPAAAHAPPAEQNLWASTIHTTFVAVPVEPGADAASANAAATRSIDVDTFTARHQVRIRLSDGSVIFADELRGHGASRSADLLGAPVLVISDNAALTCTPKATLVDRGTEYELVGPGDLKLFETTIALGPRDRPVPDSLTREPMLTATWRDSALYVEPTETSLATIDLRGDVHVEAEPNPLEQDRLDASNSLTLEFDDAPPADAAAETESAAGIETAGRRLARLIARGDARLENVSWRDAADVGQDDRSRVFYVAGQHVLYDVRTGEALVAGNGELLMHDPWTDPANAADPVEPAAANDGSFSTRGTTLFRFSRKLEMTPAVDDLFDVAMDGDVEMLHRNLDQETATLTADRLEARIRRTRAAATNPQEQLDFGGHAKLQHIRGLGNIFIRTRTRDVRCDEFFYGMDRIAQLKALPGRRVAVKTRGAGEALLADEVLWDMERDTISTRGVSGSGSR